MTTARLEVRDQLDRQRIVTIDRSPFTIGRSNQNCLPLQSADISRDHAEIVCEGAAFHIRDRSSRAGTFVNDALVEQQALRHGDLIRIGPIQMRFLVGESEAPTDGVTTTAVGDLRQAAALLEGLRALGSARVLDQVLEMVLDAAISVSSAERGFIMLAEPGGGLEFKLGRDRRRATLPGRGFQTSRKIPEQVFASRQPRLIADLRDELDAVDHAGTVALGIRNVIAVPLKLVRYAESASAAASIDEKCIGVLYLDSRERGALQSRTTLTALETLAAEAAVAIDNARLYRESQEKARLDRELQTAKEFQQALLPRAAPVRSFFAAAATMVPCLAIGGDFFEYLDFADGVIGFVVGDVAGKGVSAGLLAARVQESFASEVSQPHGPAESILRINRALVRRGLEARFVTLFFGLLSPDGRLAYCNAGHNPPVLAGRGRIRRLDRGGLIVGLFPEADYEEGEEQLEPGDRLVVFSDGISEAVDTEGVEYSDRRIVECVSASRDDADPRAIVDAVFASVRSFTSGHPQTDDMTVLAVCYKG